MNSSHAIEGVQIEWNHPIDATHRKTIRSRIAAQVTDVAGYCKSE